MPVIISIVKLKICDISPLALINRSAQAMIIQGKSSLSTFCGLVRSIKTSKPFNANHKAVAEPKINWKSGNIASDNLLTNAVDWFKYSWVGAHKMQIWSVAGVIILSFGLGNMLMADKASDGKVIDNSKKIIDEIISKYNTRTKLDNYFNDLMKNPNVNAQPIQAVFELRERFDSAVMGIYGFKKYSKPIAEFNKLERTSESCAHTIKSINKFVFYRDMIKDCNSLPDWRTEEQKKFWAKG